MGEVFRSVLRSLYYWAWDRCHCVETRAKASMDSLTIESANRSEGVTYQPTSPRLIHSFLKRLTVDHRECTFVDIGCGKGQVLLVALRFPFRAVVGIDFAAELVATCRRNLDRYRGKRRSQAAVLHQDATQYVFPAGTLVLYFYNPFSEAILRRVLDRLNASLETQPRQAYLICVGESMPYQTVEQSLETRTLLRSRYGTIYEAAPRTSPSAVRVED